MSGSFTRGRRWRSSSRPFPFTRYGTAPGRIESISSDAVDDKKLGPVYVARVALLRSTIDRGDRVVPLGPGVAARADIRTGRRSIMSDLMSPIDKARQRSGEGKVMSMAWIAGILVTGCGPLSSYTSKYNLAGDSHIFNQTPNGQRAMSISIDDQSDLILLSDEEIRSEIGGKTISPDFTIPQTSLEFLEEFLPDGSWISVRIMRGAVQITGRWHIKDKKICVEKKNARAECRSVWKSKSSGHLYIMDLDSSPRFNKAIRMLVK